MAFAKRINVFGGELPGMENRTIPDGYAETASNVRLSSNRLDPIFATATVASGRADATTIHRLLDGTWLTWTEDVDVALSPIAGDTSYRFCFTSDSFEPRVSNSAMATTSSPYPSTWYVLGVTPPVTAPGVSPAGGVSATVETRTYCYTFVTQWGEESAPSPASTPVSGKIDDTWTITPTDVAPSNSYTISAASWSGGTLTLTVNTTFGLRAGEYVTITGLAPAVLNDSWQVATAASTTVTITMANPGTITDQTGTATRDAPHNTSSMTKRIYRSVTTDTDTQFYFVLEVPVADVSEDDTPSTEVGEPLPSAGWLMPPVNLQGIKTLPSGAMIGFYDNVVCFSEPNVPYAWPSAYRNTSDYPIVGLGLIGTAAVVGTQGTPYLIDGVIPEAASMTRVDQLWPCVAKAGITSFGNGVFYPTTVGLAYLSFQGSKIVTDTMWSQYEWSDLNPSTFKAATYNNLYYTAQTSDNSETRVLVIAPDKWVTEYNVNTDVLYTDKAQSKIYYAASNGSIYELEPTSGVAQPYVWLSKIYTVPTPLNIGAVKIITRFTLTEAERAAVDAYNAAILADFVADDSGIFCGPTPALVTLVGSASSGTFTVGEIATQAVTNAAVRVISWTAGTKTITGRMLTSNAFNTTDTITGGSSAATIGTTITVSISAADAAEQVPMCTTVLGGGIVSLAETSNESMEFAILVDGEVYFSKELFDTAIIRPPIGKKYDEFQIRISSNLPVSAILIGETPDSLRTV